MPEGETSSSPLPIATSPDLRSSAEYIVLTKEQLKAARQLLKPVFIAADVTHRSKEMADARASILTHPDQPALEARYNSAKSWVVKGMTQLVKEVVPRGHSREERNVRRQTVDTILTELDLPRLSNMTASEEWVPQSETLDQIFTQRIQELAQQGINLEFLNQFIGQYNPNELLQKVRTGEVALSSEQVAFLEKIAQPGWVAERIHSQGPLGRVLVNLVAFGLLVGFEQERTKLVHPQVALGHPINTDLGNLTPERPDLVGSPLSNMGSIVDTYLWSEVGRSMSRLLFPKMRQSLSDIAGALTGTAALLIQEIGLNPTQPQSIDWADIRWGSLGPLSYLFLNTLVRIIPPTTRWLKAKRADSPTDDQV